MAVIGPQPADGVLLKLHNIGRDLKGISMNRHSNHSKAALRSGRLLLFGLIVLALTLTSLPNAVVQAAAGDLDPTFGNGGKLTTAFSNNRDFGYDVAVQADGKIVVVGTADIEASGQQFAVARYNLNGSLDATFGTGGKVTTQWGDIAFAVAIQPDGKIVVAGDNSGLGFALVRYNNDGTLDPSFGSGGKVLSSFPSSSSGAFDVLIQPDGKIVAVGYVNNGISDFCLIRYNSNGSNDLTFGMGGVVVTDFAAGDDGAWGAALQGDGKIVVAGSAFNGSNGIDFAIARYNPNGSLDATFGAQGKVITTFTSFDETAYDVAIQADGKIVVCGGIQGAEVMALARYNPNGSLDSGFGSGGKVMTRSFNKGYAGFAVAVQPDGKIIVVGNVIDSDLRSSFAVVRYTTSGNLDPAFGAGGIEITGVGLGSSAWGVAVAPDGKIIVVGNAFNETTSYDFAVTRYNGDPAFDLCVQDDSSGNLLQINSTTGAYQFTNCGGLTIGGTGTLTKRGSQITLQHNASDRRVMVSIDSSTKRATASIQLFSQGRTFSITDRNITNNTCTCR